jgi:hypothetical protein
MDTATQPAGYDPGYDPYFQASDVGPAKELAALPSDVQQAHRPFRRRMVVLGAVLAVVWLGVLVDPRIGPTVLLVLAAFGAVVGVFGAAMGLGLLGFGLCTAGDRVIAWLRRGSQWPEE